MAHNNQWGVMEIFLALMCFLMFICFPRTLIFLYVFVKLMSGQPVL